MRSLEAFFGHDQDFDRSQLLGTEEGYVVNIDALPLNLCFGWNK